MRQPFRYVPGVPSAADWFVIAKDDARRAAAYLVKKRDKRLNRALARSASDSALCCLARAMLLRNVTALEQAYQWEREGELEHAARKAIDAVYAHPYRHGGR